MVVACVAITDCIASLPSALTTATEMVLWWTSRPIYLMLSMGCSFRQAWFTASHSNHNLLRKGRPFIMRAPGLAGFETRAKPTLFRQQTPRESQLQSLDCGSQGALLGLADQEVNVLRHYSVPDDYPLVAPAYIFQHLEEQLTVVCVR